MSSNITSPHPPTSRVERSTPYPLPRQRAAAQVWESLRCNSQHNRPQTCYPVDAAAGVDVLVENLLTMSWPAAVGTLPMLRRQFGWRQPGPGQYQTLHRQQRHDLYTMLLGGDTKSIGITAVTTTAFDPKQLDQHPRHASAHFPPPRPKRQVRFPEDSDSQQLVCFCTDDQLHRINLFFLRRQVQRYNSMKRARR